MNYRGWFPQALYYLHFTEDVGKVETLPQSSQFEASMETGSCFDIHSPSPPSVENRDWFRQALHLFASYKPWGGLSRGSVVFYPLHNLCNLLKVWRLFVVVTYITPLGRE